MYQERDGIWNWVNARIMVRYNNISRLPMKTAIFFLQSTEQTERLRRLIAEAIEQKYTRFITAICLTEKEGLALTLDISSPQDFPENLRGS